MITNAEVKLWGDTVGSLVWNDQRRYALFEWNKDFLKKGFDLAPIIMPVNTINPGVVYSFPATEEVEWKVFKGLPGFIADSLPDSFGNRLIDKWLEKQGRIAGSFSPIERLCYTGRRGIGALEFFPANFEDDKIVAIDVAKLVELAESVFLERKDLQTNISYGEQAMVDIIRVGTSAGGARPKAVIAYNETTGEIKSGQIAEIPEGFAHWLLKLDGVTNSAELGLASGMGRVEYAYHLMAKDCGIEMTECRLLEENGRAHFMTRRFDRPEANEKIYMQSLCAIAGMNYAVMGAYDYNQVYSVIRQLRLPHTSIEQQYRRMVFNVLVQNCDDHTKNIAFLMDKKGTYFLTPAFDVSYAYDPTGRWNFQHFLSVNGKYKNITITDLQKVGSEQSIKNAKHIIENIKEVVANWPQYAKETGVPQVLTESIKKAHELLNNGRSSRNYRHNPCR